MADGSERTGTGIGPKHVVIGILVVVVVILAIVNADDVQVDFVFGHVEMPLFLVIVGAALIGWVIGWFVGRRD